MMDFLIDFDEARGSLKDLCVKQNTLGKEENNPCISATTHANHFDVLSMMVGLCSLFHQASSDPPVKTRGFIIFELKYFDQH